MSLVTITNRTTDMTFTWKLLEEVQGPERHLVGESRSDRRQDDVEDAKPGRRAVGKIADATELRRQIDRLKTEARGNEKRWFGILRGRGPEYFDGYRSALDDLKRIIDRIAEERSDLSNAPAVATAPKDSD